MSMMAQHVLVFGATGTAGQGAVRALLAAGHQVSAFVRPGREATLPAGVTAITGHLTLDDVARAFKSQPDVVLSCLASRSGRSTDAWAIDHAAHVTLLREAQNTGVKHFIYLSAICVQKPQLAFQKAKLAFEAALIGSSMTYSIVRPTAFFKSLSGQVARVQSGKPFLIFGKGDWTACKPISDRDLARYLTLCLTDPTLQNRMLPIGGPGPAITPRQQGEILFQAAGLEPKFRSAPVALLNGVIRVCSALGVFIPKIKQRAEFARIGKYYATESMLVWNGNAYDADATPEFGQDTLADHYTAMIEGRVTADLGDHAVF